MVNTFWNGNRLDPVQIACLASFMRRGIGVRLFSYQPMDLPPGIMWSDASAILPAESLFHFDGSPSAFSNIFRYKLLLEEGGWWVDTDMVLACPALPEVSHYWAWQDLRKINGAVLKFPKGDALCARLLAQSRSRAAALKDWGALGPDLLTELIWNTPEDVQSHPPASTYPVHWLQTHYFWFPDFAGEVKRLCSGAHFVHLWNSLFARMGLDLSQPLAEGSYLASLAPEHAAPLTAERRLVAAAGVRNYLSEDWVAESWQHVMPPGARLLLPE